MKLDKKRAEAILREEAAMASTGPVNRQWAEKVERISRMCAEGAPETHLAFLATSMLARAADPDADLFYIKPTLYPEKVNAYSARTLSETVVVPLSAELGFSIGVSGKQPLNNQPYFRMSYLGDDTPVHGGGRAVFEFMKQSVQELSELTPDQARQALRAFVAVRSGYQRTYDMAGDGGDLSPERLLEAIRLLVGSDSEGGRRAQAAAAGMLDVVYGEDRVESGRINDPSRHYAGDVVVKAAVGEGWEKSFEVRDKPVSFSDVAIFGRTCADRGIKEAAMVMVAGNQSPISPAAVREWSVRFGMGMTLFHGWDEFVDQCLFWSARPKGESAKLATATVRDRLIAVEASSSAVRMWDRLVSPPEG